MNARDLLPCPFCGGGVTLFDWGDGDCLIRCDDQSACAGSGLWSGFMQKDTDTAIAAWNRRDPAVILAAARELPEVKAMVEDRDAAFAAGVEAAAHWLETVPETLPNRQEIARAIRALATKGAADGRA
jgi:hypothetical protein